MSRRHVGRAKVDKIERWARAVMIAAAAIVVVSVLLPWKYEDAFSNIVDPYWSRGIDLDFVRVIPFLATVPFVLALFRRYEGAAAFALLGAFLTFVAIGLLAAGFLGEPDEPEDVGGGAWLSFFAWVALLIAAVIAWLSSIKRESKDST